MATTTLGSARLTGDRPAFEPRTGVLIVAAVAVIIALAALQIMGVDNGLAPILQVVYALLLVALVIVSYSSAVGLAMVEMAVAGASGGWTWLPGGISGRIMTLAIVFIAGLVILGIHWRRHGRIELGRYGLHALVVAIAIPAIWVPLGVLDGVPLRQALQDANGYAFVAFTLPFIALMARGEGASIRRWLLVACIANALFTGLLILGALTHVMPLIPTLNGVLVGPNGLAFGGAVGYMPSGAGRLYLASGLYLQVGLVLIASKLLAAPRAWAWLLYAVLLVDIAATYTRGFWLAAGAAVALVVILGARDWRRPAWIAAATLGVLLVTSVGAAAIGASVPDYLLQRAGSTLTTRPIAPGEENPGNQPVIDVAPGTQGDVLGEVSNEIRVVQARVLVGHIVERPILGSGLGAVAADYKFGTGWIYELTYLDILYKLGILGALLFLSYPLRLLLDTVRGRFGRLRLANGVDRREAVVPMAVILSVLIATASNPYLLAAYGLLPIIATVAWLDPLGSDRDA